MPKIIKNYNSKSRKFWSNFKQSQLCSDANPDSQSVLHHTVYRCRVQPCVNKTASHGLKITLFGFALGNLSYFAKTLPLKNKHYFESRQPSGFLVKNPNFLESGRAVSENALTPGFKGGLENAPKRAASNQFQHTYKACKQKIFKSRAESEAQRVYPY